MPFQFVSTINIWACAVNYIERTYRTVLPPTTTITITVIKVKDSFLYFYRYWLLKRANRTLFLQKRNSFNAKKLLYCRHYSSSNSFHSLFLFSLTSHHIPISILPFLFRILSWAHSSISNAMNGCTTRLVAAAPINFIFFFSISPIKIYVCKRKHPWILSLHSFIFPAKFRKCKSWKSERYWNCQYWSVEGATHVDI